MVATKIVLAVALVSFMQINARPAETDWAAPFETALKNITSKITEAVGENSEYTDLAKNKLTSFVDSFKSELTSLSKTLDGKPGVTDMVKEATKQWKSAVEKYGAVMPEDLSATKLNENFESSMKYIKDLYNKAEGNSEIEKEIKDFTKKQIDALTEQAKSIHAKVTEKKV